MTTDAESETLAAARRAAPPSERKGMLGASFPERVAAVRPFQHKAVRITYGSWAPYRVIECRVIGASWHLTNGNSTGDLIVAPRDPDSVFTIAGAEGVPVLSIALARIHGIEEL